MADTSDNRDARGPDPGRAGDDARRAADHLVGEGWDRFVRRDAQLADEMRAAVARIARESPDDARAFEYRLFVGRTNHVAELLGLPPLGTRNNIILVSGRISAEVAASGRLDMSPEDVDEHIRAMFAEAAGAPLADARAARPNPAPESPERGPADSLRSPQPASAAAAPQRVPTERSSTPSTAITDAPVADEPVRPSLVWRGVEHAKAYLRTRHWDRYAALRERFAVHDLDDQTVWRRATQALRVDAAGVAVQIGGRAAAVALGAGIERLAGRARPDVHEWTRAAARERLFEIVRARGAALVARGLGGGLKRAYEQRVEKARKSIKALTKAEKAPGNSAASMPAKLGKAPLRLTPTVLEFSVRRDIATGRYEPLAIFDNRGQLLVAGEVPAAPPRSTRRAKRRHRAQATAALIEALYSRNGPACLEDANLRGLWIDSLRLPPGMILKGVDLTGARLTHCSFDRAVLDRANLTRAVLDDVSLRGATLGDATVRGAALYGCDLTATRCTWRDERGLRIRDAQGVIETTGNSPAIARELYRQGLDFQKGGHFAQALPLYESAAARDRRVAQYSWSVGEARSVLGRPDAFAAYRDAFERLQASGRIERSFELLYAIATEARRTGQREAATLALEIARAPEVRRNDHQQYRSDRLYGLTAPPDRALEPLVAAFTAVPNDREVAWRLVAVAEDVHAAHAARGAARPDAMLVSAVERATARLEILERDNPDPLMPARIKRAARWAADLVRATPELAPPEPSHGDTRAKTPPAGLAEAAAGPRSRTTLSDVTEANVESFFQWQRNQAAAEPGLVPRIELFQEEARAMMVGFARESPIWSRADGDARVPLEGWEMAARLSAMQQPATPGLAHGPLVSALGASLAGLAPRIGELTGAFRFDAGGQFLDPEGDVIVGRRGTDDLRGRALGLLRSPEAESAFVHKLGGDYSAATREAICDAIEQRGTLLVAELHRDIKDASRPGGGSLQAARIDHVVARVLESAVARDDIVKAAAAGARSSRAEHAVAANLPDGASDAARAPRVVEDLGQAM